MLLMRALSNALSVQCKTVFMVNPGGMTFTIMTMLYVLLFNIITSAGLSPWNPGSSSSSNSELVFQGAI